MNRRKFIKNSALVGVGLSLFPVSACSNSDSVNNDYGFTQKYLGYDFGALEPHIDAQTMEIHYTKHHAGYVKNLAAALEDKNLSPVSLNALLESLSEKEGDIALVNNAGGHFNHSLFWDILKPGGANTPQGELLHAVHTHFGDKTQLINRLKEAALSVFGSGWAWLVLQEGNKLRITTTRNQENPMMKNLVSDAGFPIIGIDVWEHAYYLKHQNKRKDYLDSICDIINWDEVKKLYNNGLKV
jgi:Fe-Mn family superoxide dismutase